MSENKNFSSQDAAEFKGKNSRARKDSNKGNRGKQGRKDSRSKRVNFDNERVSKFERDEGRIPIRDSKNSNDISWYAKNKMLLESAGRISWNTSVGLDLPTTTSQFSIPGIMEIRVVPTYGSRFFDAVNQAANDNYSFVVHANSRNTNYDAPDLFMLQIAGIELFSLLAKGIRAYGTMRKFSEQNYYLPAELIAAQGFDYEDLKSNLSSIWFDLNELIARSDQIWIPNNMPVLERRFWLNSYAYTDADSATAQIYLFNQNLFYMLSETGSSSGTSLKAVKLEDRMTWDQYLSHVNDLFNALLNSQDRGIMFGDILKAYGAEKLYKLQPIPADYMIDIVYDREVLTQINNAVTFEGTPSTILQQNGKIVQTWEPKATPQYMPQQTVLNFHQKDAPTPEQVMIATRLTPAGITIVGSGDDAYKEPLYCGTEVPTNFITHTYQWNNQTNTFTPFVANHVSLIGRPTFANMYHWIAFDWAPIMYVGDKPTTGTGGTLLQSNVICCDYDNWTILQTLQLQKLHRTAIYSEFGIPILG